MPLMPKRVKYRKQTKGSRKGFATSGLWVRVFPDKPVTKKPIEVRMGGGKGNPEFWVAVILPGKILFEVGGVPEAVARECLRIADTKLGIRTQLVSRAR